MIYHLSINFIDDWDQSLGFLLDSQTQIL